MTARSFPRYYPLNKEAAVRIGLKKLVKEFRDWTIDEKIPRRVVHQSKTLWIEPVIEPNDYTPMIIPESLIVTDFIVGDPGSNAAFSIVESSGAIDKAYRAIIRHNTASFADKVKVYLKMVS